MTPPPNKNPSEYTEEEILDELDKCFNGEFTGFEYWATNYCKTWNEEKREVQSFATFPDNPNYRDYIFNLLHTIHDKRISLRTIEHPDLLIVKSRQLYFTTAITAYLTWCLYEDNFSGLVTSEKEEKIDGQPRNNNNTNMGKISFIISQLPVWMQPKDFLESHLKRGIPAINSLITGDSGENPGAGQMFSIHLADEFALQKFTATKLAAVRESVKGCNILLSTPRGTNNAYYDVYLQAKTNPDESSYDIVCPHWKDRIHPDKHEEFWRQAIRKYNGDMAMLNQELNHSFEGSLVRGRAFPQFMSSKHTLSLKPTTFNVGHVIAGIDFGNAHPTAVTFMTKGEDNKLLVFDMYEMSNLHPRVHALNIKQVLLRWGCELHNCTFYGDPSGESKPREGTGESSFDLFKREGIIIKPANNRVMEGIQKVNDLFYQDKLIINNSLVGLIDALNQAQFPVNRNGEITKEKYEENEFTDRLDALRYGIMQEYKPDNRQRHGHLRGLGTGNISSMR